MKTTIQGFLVELEVEDGTSSCFINKGRGSSSLEYLLGEGSLDDGKEVPQAVIDQIEKWALANGY
jgi:hypothetical protein